jgi:hypothetical protein
MLENDPQKAFKKRTAKHCLNARRQAGSNTTWSRATSAE